MFDRITSNPEVLGGKPEIADTRTRGSLILRQVADDSFLTGELES